MSIDRVIDRLGLQGESSRNMTALIVTGGEGPSPDFLARAAATADYIIAADSGLDSALAAKVVPQLALGDFDSLSDRSLLGNLKNTTIMEYETAKDDTDTELAIHEAARRGYDHIVLCGGGGGRLDHLIAIFELFKRRLRPAEWYTNAESIHLIPSDSAAEFPVLPGDAISVFHLGTTSSRMESKGLQWPLSGLSWETGQFGISNIALLSSVTIKAGTADLLVILPQGIRRA